MASSSSVMIEARGLSKFYGGFAAVRDMTYAVEKGEIVGCNVKLLRKILADAQNYIHEEGKALRPESSDLTRRAEKEYRAALCLPIENDVAATMTKKGHIPPLPPILFPQDRTIYDSTI